MGAIHDDVIKWKHFPRYWPFVRGIHRWPVNSPHKCQWRGALIFSLNCAWINGWVNKGEAGDFIRYRAHYDVTLMKHTDNNFDNSVDSATSDEGFGCARNTKCWTISINNLNCNFSEWLAYGDIFRWILAWYWYMLMCDFWILILNRSCVIIEINLNCDFSGCSSLSSKRSSTN